MVETPPGASLEVVESDLLLELLMVALDAPTEIGESHEFLERRTLSPGCRNASGGIGPADRVLVG